MNIDTSKWSVHQKVDWQIVLAEMNGYDFNSRVLKPWERDPAFYQTIWMYESDVPAHEGPTNHAVLEFWSYDFPLTDVEGKRLERKLSIIPSLLAQSRKNLTGKYLVERLMAEYAEMKERDEKSFVMKDFMREFNKVGNIPIELLRWDMTGKKPKSIH